jgi:hypothetical protein
MKILVKIFAGVRVPAAAGRLLAVTPNRVGVVQTGVELLSVLSQLLFVREQVVSGCRSVGRLGSKIRKRNTPRELELGLTTVRLITASYTLPVLQPSQ